MRDLFDPNPGHRIEADWRELLAGLVASLTEFTGVPFAPTSWYTGDDEPGHRMSSNCVNVRGAVNPALWLEACGVVCVTINFGEAAWASADVLLFSGGRRVLGPNGLGLVSLVYNPGGWASQGWVADEYGEWESHQTDARWQDAEPGAAADTGRM